MRQIGNLVGLAVVACGVAVAGPPSMPPQMPAARAGDEAAQIAAAEAYSIGEPALIDARASWFWARVAGRDRPAAAWLMSSAEEYLSQEELRLLEDLAAAWEPGMRGLPRASGILAFRRYDDDEAGESEPVPFRRKELRVIDAVARRGISGDGSAAISLVVTPLLLDPAKVGDAPANPLGLSVFGGIVLETDAEGHLRTAMLCDGDEYIELSSEHLILELDVRDDRVGGTLRSTASLAPGVEVDLEFEAPFIH